MHQLIEISALVQFRTGPKPDGIKHTVAHTIVLCMHQQCFIPSVIGPVRNCISAEISISAFIKNSVLKHFEKVRCRATRKNLCANSNRFVPCIAAETIAWTLLLLLFLLKYSPPSGVFRTVWLVSVAVVCMVHQKITRLRALPVRVKSIDLPLVAELYVLHISLKLIESCTANCLLGQQIP